METNHILIAVLGVVGVKEIWSIWKKYIDNKKDSDDYIMKYKADRVKELETKLDEMSKEVTRLTSLVSRLEERLLHVAKDRFKDKIA